LTGFAFTPAALAAARALARRDRVKVAFEPRDVFTLGRDLPNAFDGVWDYTCFCAIDPARRAEYVRSLAGPVRPGGGLLGNFFPQRAFTAGPPYAVRSADVPRLLAPWFRVERARPPPRHTPGRVR